MFKPQDNNFKVYNFKNLHEEDKREILGLLGAISAIDSSIGFLKYDYGKVHPEILRESLVEHAKETLEDAQVDILAQVEDSIISFIDGYEEEIKEIQEADGFLYGFAEEYPEFAKLVFPDDEEITEAADTVLMDKPTEKTDEEMSNEEDISPHFPVKQGENGLVEWIGTSEEVKEETNVDNIADLEKDAQSLTERLKALTEEKEPESSDSVFAKDEVKTEGYFEEKLKETPEEEKEEVAENLQKIIDSKLRNAEIHGSRGYFYEDDSVIDGSEEAKPESKDEDDNPTEQVSETAPATEDSKEESEMTSVFEKPTENTDEEEHVSDDEEVPQTPEEKSAVKSVLEQLMEEFSGKGDE